MIMKAMLEEIKSIYKRSKYFFSPNLTKFYELGAYREKWIVPKMQPPLETDCYVPTKKMECTGLGIDEKQQLRRLKYWHDNYRDYFDLIRRDQEINTQFYSQDYLHNGYYPTPDAEIYSSMVLDLRPKHILEVGSGYSTLIAKRIIDAENIDCSIDVIDPEPRTDVKRAAEKIITKYVEDVPFPEMNITPSSLLFIDSSHICRSLGDIPYLFCEILPKIPAGALVHVHDIFLPYDYPAIYQKWLYNEQYVLHGVLSNSSRYKILFATHYMSRKFPGEMQMTFGSIVGKDSRFFGASFWFEVQ